MPENAERRDTERLIDRIELSVALVLQVGILVVTVGALLERQWLGAFTGSIVLMLTFAPALLARRLRVTLPVEFTLLTSAFLYASFALGESRDFYEKFWWWDLALHGTSALIVGIIGFLSIYVFYAAERVKVKAGWIATITFAIAVSLGTLWELFEFAMDWFFGFNMQKSGLVDTMTDLMINACGALVAAISGFLYVRKEGGRYGRRVIRAYAARKNK